jgi:hypothetical protein
VGKAEQLHNRYRWYMSYLANRKSESGSWNYLDLRTCLTDRVVNEALHQQIGADIPVEITPPDIHSRSFDDEPTYMDTKRTVAIIEVEE